MDLSLHLFPAIKVTIVFVLWLIVIPGWYSFDQRETDFLGRVFRNFTQGVLFTCVTVYILAALKLFEVFSVLLVLAAYVTFIRVGVNKSLLLRMQNYTEMALGSYFDWLDGRIKLGEQIRQKISFSRLMAWIKRITLLDVAAAGVFGWAVYLRFYPRVVNLTLVEPIATGPPGGDPYVHLTWVKMLRNNIIFPDGIYPMGYHAVLSMLQGFSQQDYYHILRFAGPIGTSMMIFGLYWFLLRVSHSRQLSLLGMSVFALSAGNGIPINFARQIVSLPMEFSIILMFPGLVFLYDYLRCGDTRDLYLYGCTLISILLIHSYGAVFMGIGSFGLFLSSLVYGQLRTKLIKLLTLGFISGVIGNLPLLIGMLANLPWHSSSTSFIAENINKGSSFDIGLILNQLVVDYGKPIVFSLEFMMVVLVIMSVYQLFRKVNQREIWPLAVFWTALIFIILYIAPRYGGPSLISDDRLQLPLYLSIIAAFTVVLRIIGELLPIFAWRKYISSLVLISLIVTWVINFPPIPSSHDPENTQVLVYPSATKVFFKIKKEFPSQNWTIVAPVEQYQEVLNYGFHYELWKFIEDFPVQQASSGKFDPSIPTKFIFLYIEKVPLRIWEEGVLETKAISLVGPTEKYYRDAPGRAKLEKDIADWCAVYSTSHNNISVYYEDDVLRVYLIEHDPEPYV